MSVARPAKEIAEDIAANVASGTEVGAGRSIASQAVKIAHSRASGTNSEAPLYPAVVHGPLPELSKLPNICFAN
jgi:hypothetical protein